MAAVSIQAILDYAPHAALAILILWLTSSLFSLLRPTNRHSLRTVAILVLGDIGRSPRMMYHAQSFAENGFVTDVVAYGGSKPIPALERLPKVQLRYLQEPPKIAKRLPFVLAAPIKVLHEVISILWVLLVQIEVPPEFILVQNPPSIPTLAIAQLVSYIRGSKIIIDWHNLGYTILALKLGERHPFVRISKWFEGRFGKAAYAHLFVTRAMRDFLIKQWDIQGLKEVLYDRPPRHFHRSSAQEVHELFRKLQPVLSPQAVLREFLPEASPPYSTAFTEIKRRRNDATSTYSEINSPSLRPDRPALLVSSTSWTPDEDFGILLDALKVYNAKAEELNAAGDKLLPKLLVILTGKGPLKDKYMSEVGRLQESWEWVRCITLWLEAEDYPILLGAADLGVCLHSSSSALDLPMKVVDMFGCGLPVCALKFECLPELVRDGKNGLIFEDARQLAQQLQDLFSSFPNSSTLKTLASSLANTSKSSTTQFSHPHATKPLFQSEVEGSHTWNTWDENWGRVIRPLILRDVNL